MYLWDEQVGRYEKKMLKGHPLAFATVCVDGALFRIKDLLPESVPKKSMATVTEAVHMLWIHLTMTKGGVSPLTKRMIKSLEDLYPDEDDRSVPSGWGELVSAVTLTCEMARGDDPVDTLLDCIGYAYQGILQMAIKTESKRSKTTEKAIRNFEAKSPLCQFEIKFQLAQLDATTAGKRVQSALYPGLHYPK